MKTKEQKRLEAQVRQEEYDALTLKERLNRARDRGGSKQEVARLAAAIQKELGQ